MHNDFLFLKNRDIPVERESIRQLFHCPGQTAPLFIALHVILAPHSLLVLCNPDAWFCHQLMIAHRGSCSLFLAGHVQSIWNCSAKSRIVKCNQMSGEKLEMSGKSQNLCVCVHCQSWSRQVYLLQVLHLSYWKDNRFSIYFIENGRK